MAKDRLSVEQWFIFRFSARHPVVAKVLFLAAAIIVLAAVLVAIVVAPRPGIRKAGVVVGLLIGLAIVINGARRAVRS